MTREATTAATAPATELVSEARPASPVLGGRMPWPVAGAVTGRRGRRSGSLRDGALNRHLDGDGRSREQAAEKVGGNTTVDELARDATTTTGGDNNFVLTDVRGARQEVQGGLAAEGLSNRAGDRGDEALLAGDSAGTGKHATSVGDSLDPRVVRDRLADGVLDVDRDGRLLATGESRRGGRNRHAAGGRRTDNGDRGLEDQVVVVANEVVVDATALDEAQ